MKLERILALPAIKAAPLLLGCVIKKRTTEGVISLKIVETEAYHQEDPASHSFKWKTARTAPMFEAGGVLYVYFTYGMHYCVNIVVGQKGVGEAVLLRAGEPVEGTETMRKNRGGVEKLENIANGPGKLAQALGIKGTSLSGKTLNKSSIWLETPNLPVNPKQIVVTPRIGITHGADSLLRFYLRDNPFVSGHKRV